MRGYGSVVSIVITMFFIAVLVLLYMRTMMRSAPETRGQATAIERTRDTAAAVEEQQRRYNDDLRKQLE
ncbi:MAG: hypothetical protein ACREQY_02795 [Candidatus Binatia bacterium]